MLDYRPDQKAWSVRQIVAHLADSEMEGGVRFRRIIAEDHPTLVAYDQDAWAENLDYGRRKPSHSLETFRMLRNDNYQLLKELPEGTFARTANHSERGSMTLGQWLEIYARHAEKHADQIKRTREAFKATQTAK